MPMIRLTAGAAVLLAISGCGSQSLSARQPSGLTVHGRVVWNLDALLHDTFGNKPAYENYGRGGIPNLSTRFISEAQSNYYVFTFAKARHSRFKAVRPNDPPKAFTAATGDNEPVTIRGAYISCGDNEWLYERNGQDLPIGPMWCSRSAIP